MKYIKKAIDIKYHRNGISGCGFFVINFILAEKGNQKLTAIVFEDMKGEKEIYNHYAIINPLDLKDKYRGDNFIEELIEIIKKFENTNIPYEL